LFRADFYLDGAAMRRAIERQESFNIIETTRVVKVDIVVRKDTEYRRTEFSRKRRISVEGQDLFIVAPEDLIISKLDWAKDSRSETQLRDVRNVLASVSDLDRTYLAYWTSQLGIEALYRELGP
jgi:hypothetical protein